MKPIIWLVTFRCESSSGSDNRIDRTCHDDLVWTIGRSLDDVEKSIRDGLDNQTRFVELVSAKCLGETNNPLAGTYD